MANYGGWLGILKWSLAQSDGLGTSEDVQPMSEEEMKWLHDAFASMTVDESKRMVELSQMLLPTAEAATDADRAASRISALDELSDLVESVDNAKNLFMVGGFEPLMACLDSSASAPVQKRCAEVLTTVVQNNPKAQLWALEAGCLTALAALLPSVGDGGSDAPEFGLYAAVCSAMSALVRDNQTGQHDLLPCLSQLRETLLASAQAGTGVERCAGERRQAVSDPAAVSAARRCLRKGLFFFRHLVRGAESGRVLSYLTRGMGPVGSGLGADATEDSAHWFVHMAKGLLRPGALQEHGDDSDLRDARENCLVICCALGAPTESFLGVMDDTGDVRQPRALGQSGPGQRSQQQPERSEAPLLLTAGEPYPVDEDDGTPVTVPAPASTGVGRTGISLVAARQTDDSDRSAVPAVSPSPALPRHVPSTSRLLGTLTLSGGTLTFTGGTPEAPPRFSCMSEAQRRVVLRQAGLYDALQAHASSCSEAAGAALVQGPADEEAAWRAAVLGDEERLSREAAEAMIQDTTGQQ